MSQELENEKEVINAIYGADTLRTVDGSIYVLSIPRETSLRVSFPRDYPASIPHILRIESTGDHTRKGYGKYITDVSRDILRRIFTPGSVCVFDLLQETDTAVMGESSDQVPASPGDHVELASSVANTGPPLHPDLEKPPQ